MVRLKGEGRAVGLEAEVWFQFLMVRLKAVAMVLERDALLAFQFLMVRLKAGVGTTTCRN